MHEFGLPNLGTCIGMYDLATWFSRPWGPTTWGIWWAIWLFCTFLFLFCFLAKGDQLFLTPLSDPLIITNVSSSHGALMFWHTVTTFLEQPLVVWEAGNTQNFSLEVEIGYPVLTVTYSPGIWQLLKFAWIQYLAIFVIFWWILSKVQSFMFQNQVILTVRKKERQHKQ